MNGQSQHAIFWRLCIIHFPWFFQKLIYVGVVNWRSNIALPLQGAILIVEQDINLMKWSAKINSKAKFKLIEIITAKEINIE